LHTRHCLCTFSPWKAGRIEENHVCSTDPLGEDKIILCVWLCRGSLSITNFDAYRKCANEGIFSMNVPVLPVQSGKQTTPCEW
jgi:hypothetical protein